MTVPALHDETGTVMSQFGLGLVDLLLDAVAVAAADGLEEEDEAVATEYSLAVDPLLLQLEANLQTERKSVLDEDMVVCKVTSKSTNPSWHFTLIEIQIQ